MNASELDLATDHVEEMVELIGHAKASQAICMACGSQKFSLLYKDYNCTFILR
jgi:hypothetical protein